MTRVAIVHERFTEFAGSEQVVAQLAEEWPDATVVAPVARADAMPVDLGRRITSTRLSRLLRGSGYAHLLPALPIAMRHLPLGDHDVVIASHHAFADQVVHATTAPVIAYVHSPARWVWDAAMRRGEVGGRIGAVGLGAFAAAYRGPDRRAAHGLHTIVANSTEVASRVHRWWGRTAQVVHPPVDTDFYTPDSTVEREDFVLLAGRLVSYKQPMVAIEAAGRASVPLVVAGDGRQRADCEKIAGPDTTFVGRVSDDELRSLFRRCRAVLMPGVEDFGIIPVEAQACGAPVYATAAGGALDTVIPGVTGELVPAGPDGTGSVDAWTTALQQQSAYDPTVIRAHAERFSRSAFRTAMADVVKRVAADR